VTSEGDGDVTLFGDILSPVLSTVERLSGPCASIFPFTTLVGATTFDIPIPADCCVQGFGRVDCGDLMTGGDVGRLGGVCFGALPPLTNFGLGETVGGDVTSESVNTESRPSTSSLRLQQQ